MRQNYRKMLAWASATVLLLGAGWQSAAASVPLPDYIKEKGKLVVGTYCDYPPFGFTGPDQKPQGTDPSLAKHLADIAFGDPSQVEFQCVRSDQRISFLQSNRIDILISTLGVTPERSEVISFSNPYFASTTLFLAQKGTEFASFKELGPAPLAISSGSVWINWLKKCQPHLNLLQYDSIPSQIEALAAGRVKAILSDSTLVLPLAEKNPNFVVTGPSVDEQGYQWAIGMRKDDLKLVEWVNAALDEVQEKDLFWKDLVEWIPNETTRNTLEKVTRRPGATPDYSTFQASVVADPSCPQ